MYQALCIGVITPILGLAFLLTLATREDSLWDGYLKELAVRKGMDERFSDIVAKDTPWIQDYKGIWSRHGLTLEAGQKGYARLTLQQPPGVELGIRIWAYDYGGCLVRWWPVDGSLRSAVNLSRGSTLVGRGFRIPLAPKARSVILEVSGENHTSAKQLLLDRITVGPVSSPYLRWWVMGFWLWGALCFLWWIFAAQRKWWEPRGGILLWGGGLAVLLIGGTLRLHLLSFMAGVPLDQDVSMYRLWAKTLQWFNSDYGFYSAFFGSREPLWVALVQFWQMWVGEGEPSLRLLTALLSTAVIGLTGVFLWRWGRLGRFWVIAGMLMMGLNPVLIAESCRGLRSELMTAGFMLFLMISLPAGKSRFRPILAGVFAGAWALLRAPALGIAFGVWCGFWFLGLVRKRWPARRWLPAGYSLQRIVLAMALSLILFVPYLWGFQSKFGDWRHPSNGYARWNANMEFQGRLGTPGFPTHEEFKKNPYSGPPISYGEYVFGLHTPLQVLAFQFMGWGELTGSLALSLSSHSLPLSYHFREHRMAGIGFLINPALILSMILGMIALVSWFALYRDLKLWWAPLMLLWGTYYVAFVYHARLVELYRHSVHVYPLMVLLTLWGLQRLTRHKRFGPVKKVLRLNPNE